MQRVAISDVQQKLLRTLLGIKLSLWQMLWAKQPETPLNLPALCLIRSKVSYCFAAHTADYHCVRLGMMVPMAQSLLVLILHQAILYTYDATDHIAGGVQNAQALFQQGQSRAQQTGAQAFQQATDSLPGSVKLSQEFGAAAARHPAAKPVHGRTLTFDVKGGQGTLSSSSKAEAVPAGRLMQQQSALDLLST